MQDEDVVDDEDQPLHATSMPAAFLALRTLVAGFLVDFYSGLMGVAFATVIWWFAVGFGLRLGVTPDEFLASVLSALGFGTMDREESRSSELRGDSR